MKYQAEQVLKDCLNSYIPSITLELCGLEILSEDDFSIGLRTYYFEDGSRIEDIDGDLEEFYFYESLGKIKL